MRRDEREPRMREALRGLPLPDEREAEERARRVVVAAHARRAPAPRSRRRLRAALAAAAVVAAVAAAALTPPGEAVADWLGDVIRPGREDARPALDSLPAPGRLLVVSDRGPWVVHPDGSKRLLGAYDAASWSPNGLFVVVTRGRRLVAVEPDGTPRWSLTRPEPVSGARWSPSGFRIAYLTGPRGGHAPAPAAHERPHALRIVAGDGSGDHLLDRSAAGVAPAWRPAARRHLLAYADPDGRLRLVDADTRATLWETGPGEVPVQLAWSADGQRLLALARRSLRIVDGSGRLLAMLRLERALSTPAAGSARMVAFRGDGHTFALVRESGRGEGSEVALLRAERRHGSPRPVFAGPGAFSDLAWSPDGRWLLVAWPSADQWVFIRPGADARVRAVGGMAREFAPGASGPADPPRVVEWCCAD